MERFRTKLAVILEALAHWLRYRAWHHVADWELAIEPEAKKIIEDFFGDVYVLHYCRHCRQPFLGEYLGSTLIENIDDEAVYTGIFKAGRLNRFTEQGYALAE